MAYLVRDRASKEADFAWWRNSGWLIGHRCWRELPPERDQSGRASAMESRSRATVGERGGQGGSGHRCSDAVEMEDSESRSGWYGGEHRGEAIVVDHVATVRTLQ